MRKVLVTLTGAGLLASLIISSCVVKEKDDDGEGGSTATGGTTSLFAGGATSSTKGGSGVGGGTSTDGISVAEECPDLMGALGAGNVDVCSTSKAAASFSEINMLIVLDKSGSMASTPDGYTKTKWAGAVDSLKTALKPAEKLVKYGFMLYPYLSDGNATSCELATSYAAVNIPVDSADVSVPAINDLMAKTTPGGGTPTASALGAAFDYYTKGPGASLVGAKYVLLVTDGGPNCNSDVVCGPETCTANMDKSGSCGTGVPNCCDIVNQVEGRPNPQSLCLDDASVVGKIQALAAEGIKTFVVGIPGTEQYASYLDTFAVEGGAPVTDPAKTRKYYEVTGESGLVEAFNDITTSLVRSCVVPLEQKPLDLNNINLAIDCSPVAQKTSESISNWHYDADQQAIVIEGTQCTRIETTGVKRVDVVLGCPPFQQL